MVGQHYIKFPPKPFMGRIACKSKALNLIFAYTMMHAWTKHDSFHEQMGTDVHTSDTILFNYVWNCVMVSILASRVVDRGFDPGIRIMCPSWATCPSAYRCFSLLAL